MIIHVGEYSEVEYSKGENTEGEYSKGNKVGGDLRPLFVIIKKGENVIFCFDDLTNLGTL